MSLKPSRLNYCQFLLSSPVNFTINNFAAHIRGFGHDAVNRYLQGGGMTSRLVWEHVKDAVIPCVRGCIVFDDSILDKNH